MSSLIEIIKLQSSEIEPIRTKTSASLKKIAGIKCVLFDIYGTLMVSGVGDISHSTEDNRKHAIHNVFNFFKIPLKNQLIDSGLEFFRIVKEQQAISSEKGIDYPEIDIREVWMQFIEENSEIRPEEITDGILEELSVRFELKVNATWPMPFLESTLCGLRNHELKLGIVSNAQFFTPMLFDAYLGKNVDELGFSEDLCRWSYSYKEAKPSTCMYRQNAMILEAKYGIQPHEVLYVGNDMLNDIVPAYQCGFKTGLFAGDERSLRLRQNDERVSGIKADLIITSLDQIIDCILV